MSETQEAENYTEIDEPAAWFYEVTTSTIRLALADMQCPLLALSRHSRWSPSLELLTQADNSRAERTMLCSPFWYVKAVDLNDADSQANNRVAAFRL